MTTQAIVERRRVAAEAVSTGMHRLWLAALGVVPTIQESGGHLFETLVEHGEKVQEEYKSRRTETGVGKKVSDAVGTARTRVGSGVSEISEAVRGLTRRSEKAFDKRVAAALERSGLPTREEFETLMQRLDQVAAALEESRPSRAKGRKRSTKSAAKTE